MKVKILLGIITLLLFTCISLGAVESSGEQEAQTVAEQWLDLIDEGNYGESWQESAEYFRKAVTREQWMHTVQALRKPLGQVISRKKQSVNYKTSLPGAPDGKYFVIQFTTSFENKKVTVETVTPMLDQDGQWRVSGYYIK